MYMWLNHYITVSVIKLARVQYFMTELCQFLGGDCKVIIAVNQRSDSIGSKEQGRRADFVKKDTPAEGERSQKRQKSGFLKNSKISDCGPTSAARELKKEMNVRT
jgi:hypothetical protein